MTNKNDLNENKVVGYYVGDAVKPNHYRKGKIDLIESWYLLYPFNEFRTAMKTHIDKYMKRYEQKNGWQDLAKADEFKRRLEEYERLEGVLE